MNATGKKEKSNRSHFIKQLQMIDSEALEKERKNYDHCLEEGIEYQDFICEKLKIIPISSKANQIRYGETYVGIEIKFDKKFHETHHLFIETASIGKSGKMQPSGIMMRDNSYLYLIGNKDISYVFTKRRLIAIACGFERIKPFANDYREGYRLPIDLAEIHAEEVFEWKCDEQSNLKPFKAT